jgi:hypothetical protein
MDRRNYTVKKLINFTLRPTITTGINSSNIKWVRFGEMRNPYKVLLEKPYARDVRKHGEIFFPHIYRASWHYQSFIRQLMHN